ncbi:MAG: MBL fold metallo-hydrolase [Blastocatellia bacterium]|nr:MBL fold metallo-hydrolase [Blastocatellia bacterium]
MRFSVIGSGSSGNATLVQAGETTVLVDVGLSAKETVRRMRAVGFEPTALSAILITHEHGDHVGGMPVLARQLGIPVHIAHATRQVCKLTEKDWNTISWGENVTSNCPIEIGPVRITPVSVPHDAAEPFIFTLVAEGIKMAVVTDLGIIPKHVAEHLRGCHALVLEANHDRDMLKIGPYPWGLKQRIASRLGHLSNDEMARFLVQDFDGGAEHLVLAHLSEHNNHPEIARLAALQALDSREPLFAPDWEKRLRVAHPKIPMEWTIL